MSNSLVNFPTTSTLALRTAYSWQATPATRGVVALALTVFGLLGSAVEARASYQPVLVLSSSGHAPESVKAALAETMSASFNEAVLATYASELYGNSNRFAAIRTPSRFEHRGSLGLAGKVFQEFDRRFQTKFEKKLKPSLQEITGDVAIEAHLLWAKRSALPNLTQPVLPMGQGLGLAWHLMKTVIDRRTIPEAHQTLVHGADLLADVGRLAVYQEDDLKDGLVGLLADGPGIYEFVRDQAASRLEPLYLRFSIEANNTNIVSNLSVTFIPPMTSIKQAPAPGQLMKADFLVQNPPYFASSKKYPVARASFQRMYSTNSRAAIKPTLTFSFGQLLKHINVLVSCRTKCAATGPKGGLIHSKRYAPTVETSFQATGPLATTWLANSLSKKLNRSLRVSILLNEIVVDLDSSGGTRVIPERSNIGIIIQTRTPMTGTLRYFDGLPYDRGFNITGRLLRSNVVSRLTSVFDDELTAAEAATDRRIVSFAEELVKTIDQQL